MCSFCLFEVQYCLFAGHCLNSILMCQLRLEFIDH